MPKIPPIFPEERFFLALQKNYVILQRIVEADLQRIGITVAEYTLLRTIEHTPGITAGEARERLYASAPSVAQLVKNMDRNGFIRRLQHKDDARRQPLVLTTKGKKTLALAKRRIARLIRDLHIPPTLVHSLTKGLLTLLPSLPSYGQR